MLTTSDAVDEVRTSREMTREACEIRLDSESKEGDGAAESTSQGIKKLVATPSSEGCQESVGVGAPRRVSCL